MRAVLLGLAFALLLGVAWMGGRATDAPPVVARETPVAPTGWGVRLDGTGPKDTAAAAAAVEAGPAPPAPGEPGWDGRVRGRVVDGDGRPVTTAHVTGWWDGSGGPRPLGRVAVDGDGAFALEAAFLADLTAVSRHAGQLILVAEAPGHVPPSRPGFLNVLDEFEPLVVPADGRVVALELLQKEAVVRGRVLDEGGHPVSGAEVSGAAEGLAHTAPDGRFALEAQIGKGLFVLADGTPGRAELDFELPAECAEVDFDLGELVLRPVRLLEGVVVTADGAPAAEAALEWEADDGHGSSSRYRQPITADAAGAIRADMAVEDQRGVIRCVEAVLQDANLALRGWADVRGEGPVRLVLEGHRYALCVRDEDGLAVPGAVIRGELLGDDGPTGQVVDVTTGANGVGYVRAEPGRQLRFTAWAPHGLPDVREVEVPQGSSASSVDFTVRSRTETGTLLVEVQDPEGASPGSEVVEVFLPVGLRVDGGRSTGGLVAFRLSPGPYRVAVPFKLGRLWEPFAEWARVTADVRVLPEQEARVVIRCPILGRVAVRAIDGTTGEEIDVVGVTLPAFRGCQVDLGGHPPVGDVPQGLQHLRVQANGYRDRDVEVEVVGGETTPVTVALEPDP